LCAGCRRCRDRAREGAVVAQAGRKREGTSHVPLPSRLP
jgi:hypothetical protein